jgi:hypothetical protein
MIYLAFIGIHIKGNRVSALRFFDRLSKVKRDKMVLASAFLSYSKEHKTLNFNSGNGV